MEIRIINKSTNLLPQYATEGSSGMDLRANLSIDVIIHSMERVVIPTGLYIELIQGYEAQVRSRSGLSLNQGLVVANSPGTIDADYRGEIKVILINLSKDDVVIKHGDRIAQLVVAPYIRVEWLNVETLESTMRNEQGFGSTGVK